MHMELSKEKEILGNIKIKKYVLGGGDKIKYMIDGNVK